MSNATAVIIDFIVWRARTQKEAGAEDVQLERIVDLTADIETDDPGVSASSLAEEEETPAQNKKRRRLGKRMVESITVEGGRSRVHKTAAQAADEASTKAIRLWQNGCIVCRAQGRRTRLQHGWETCRIDVDAVEAVRQGVEFISNMRAPFRRQGFRCWARGEGCRCVIEGRRGGCSGGDTIRSAVSALIFVGNREIREWVEERDVFTRSIEAGEEIRVALEELLSKKGSFDGVQQAGIDGFIAR